MRSLLKVLLTSVVGVLLLTACEEDKESYNSEMNVQLETYNQLVKKEPAKNMTNPKTRETINFWTETWNNPEQLAYVYLQNSNGDMIGYYVLDGAPVSMCASLTPNYDTIHSGSGGYTVIPTPSIDGIYRSSEDCSRYFGKDASTGTYVEFTVGMGINMLLYTEPLSNTGAVNLAPQ